MIMDVTKTFTSSQNQKRTLAKTKIVVTPCFILVITCTETNVPNTNVHVMKNTKLQYQKI